MSEAERELIRIYEEAQRRLMTVIGQKATRGSFAAHERRLLRQVRAILSGLKKKTPGLVGPLVRDAYEQGLRDARADLVRMGLMERDYDPFSRLHVEQIELIAQNTSTDLRHAVNLVGRRIEDELREAGLEMSAQKIATGQTMTQAWKELQGRLLGLDLKQPDGRIGVRYRNGHIEPIDSYAKMVARTTPAEAQNTAKFVQAEAWGYDLVKCTKYGPTCEVCDMYQGRVYALTREAANGKYYGLRFPMLYETALWRGYETIHPNCRHRFSIFAPRAYSREQLEEESRNAMRPFEDTRTDRERKAYAAEQAYNRQRNQNLREYQLIKATLPDEAPKTFSGFLSMKRADSQKYKDLKEDMKAVKKALA